MGRRYSLRGISKARVYKVKHAARIIGVSEATLRKWAKEGLRLIKDQLPYLVRGCDLIDFLTKRQSMLKAPMAEGQFYCLGCSAPCAPRDGVVHFSPMTSLTGRLSALCDECGRKVGRFCKAADADALDQSLKVLINAPA